MAAGEAELAIFPLGIVVLPSELVPLHIFEERYKNMVEVCLEHEREFGIVWLSDDGLKEIGCSCKIAKVVERHEDGNLDIVVQGSNPFRLISRSNDRPYPTGEVTFLHDEDEEQDEEAARSAHTAYAELVTEATGKEAEPEDVAGRSSFELAARVDFGPDAKQGLLELRSENERLEFLAQLLRAARKRLELAERIESHARSNGKVYFR